MSSGQLLASIYKHVFVRLCVRLQLLVNPASCMLIYSSLALSPSLFSIVKLINKELVTYLVKDRNKNDSKILEFCVFNVLL